ncbi:hypothetical protein D3227_04770 [Mesorhizobium waimense]|uniref:MarR family transcriptional regulator n=1 Tax=Mesorhizobium waimense TaxID=1300307 RepID=A0A3A5KYP8_9HYPH|nr:hypothetical protein [Mesorhizobium waimense]RJT41995.1 hypothetical protein D3227_04770 [Mesorhizobium waimense]
MILSDREQRVLVYMSEDVPPEYGVYMRAIRAAEVIEPRNVRRVVRALARKGMVKLLTLSNPADFYMAGSGYVVTSAGRAEADRLKDEVVL